MVLRHNFARIHWILSTQFGLDPLIFFRSVRRIPFFVRDLLDFNKTYSGNLILKPCLHDRFEEGGSTQSEYFWQDLFVARLIYDANPKKHVDVGSRVDGFVAHVASFREIEVIDVRPINTHIPGIVFKQIDLMKPFADDGGYCDSLSCLHAIEHFGLGRYGDPVDPFGYKYGIANMAKLLKSSGKLYLSVPIGQERVEFNANRVFDPNTIVCCAKEHDLHLLDLLVVPSGGGISQIDSNKESLQELAQNHYNLCVFIFLKK